MESLNINWCKNPNYNNNNNLIILINYIYYIYIYVSFFWIIATYGIYGIKQSFVPTPLILVNLKILVIFLNDFNL